MEASDPQQDPLGQLDLNQETGRFNFVDILTQEGLLCPPIHQGSTSQRFDGGTSSTIHQFSRGPSTLQGASTSGALLGSIDLSALSAYIPFDHVGPTSRTTRYEDAAADGRNFYCREVHRHMLLDRCP
ncbi:hypothetical protein SLE2022_301760 [Rubroshorea leprosula]